MPSQKCCLLVIGPFILQYYASGYTCCSQTSKHDVRNIRISCLTTVLLQYTLTAVARNCVSVYPRKVTPKLQASGQCSRELVIPVTQTGRKRHIEPSASDLPHTTLEPAENQWSIDHSLIVKTRAGGRECTMGNTS